MFLIERRIILIDRWIENSRTRTALILLWLSSLIGRIERIDQNAGRRSSSKIRLIRRRLTESVTFARIDLTMITVAIRSIRWNRWSAMIRSLTGLRARTSNTYGEWADRWESTEERWLNYMTFVECSIVMDQMHHLSVAERSLTDG